MPNINIVGDLNTGSAILDTALTALGLNGWKLADGSYNGCTFASFVKIPILENNPIFTNGEDLIAAINEITGVISGVDPNGVFNLYNTFLSALQIESEPVYQIVEKKLPFSNRCNTENTGTGGYVFRMTLIFLGSEYQKAVSNFENACLYPPSNPAIALSLVHPTRGRIPGITRITMGRVTESVGLWNGATVNVTFRSEQTFKGSIPSNPIQNFTNALQAALATALGISTTVANFMAIVNSSGRVPTGQTSNITYTQSKNISDSSIQVANSLVANTNYIYKTSNTLAVNSTLSSTPINYSLLPKTLNQVVNYAPVQATIIMNYYMAKVKVVNDLIAASPFKAQANELVNILNQSISDLNAVALLVLPRANTISYKTPYAMSLRTLLVLNGISLDQSLRIYNNNPQILSPNYIAEGTVVQL